VALLLAIGARAGDVLRFLFVTEAGMIGLAGGALAVGTGSLVGRWLVQAVFGTPTGPQGVLWLVGTRCWDW